jgi:hypothetical protein
MVQHREERQGDSLRQAPEAKISMNESELGWNHKEPIGRVAPGQPTAPAQRPQGIPTATAKQSGMIFKAIKSFGKMKAAPRSRSTGRRGVREITSTQAIHITHRNLFQ